MPRELGDYENKKVTVGVGRFGPYIRHNNQFVSLPKTDDPYSVGLERAIELIEAKREKERNAVIKTFAEDADLRVLNGRWGPYIAYKKSNFRIPKGTQPETLTYEACLKLIEEGGKTQKRQKK